MPRFHVQRSIQIEASPDKVFEAVADYRTWTAWSPWLCAEPTADVTVSDIPSAVGSVYHWKGELVGEGEIEHRGLEPGRVIEDEVRFVKPFRSRSRVVFELQPAGQGSRITWHMHGSMPWFLFWMVSQMEVFIGMDYDRGLSMLKEWIETGKVLSQTNIRGTESVGPLRMVGVRQTCPIREIGPSMATALAEAARKLSEHNLPADCEPMSVYHQFDIKAQTFDYTSGFVFPESPAPIPEGLSSWSMQRTNALCVEHVGSYGNLGNAWSAANQYARYKKLKLSKVCGFELYRNDPKNTPPAELRTEIYLPLKRSGA